MKQREKILFLSAVGLLGFVLGLTLLRKMLLNPISQAKQDIARLEVDIEKQRTEISRGRLYARKYYQWAEHSFGPDEAQASENVRAHILRILETSRIDTRQFTMSPVTGGKEGGGREIGWTVRIGGSLDQVTTLLYMLQTDTALHRLESINWRPVPRSTQVELSFTYRTLAMEEPIAGDPASARRHVSDLLGKYSLSGSEFARFDPIPGEGDGPSPGWNVTVTGPVEKLDAFVERMDRDPYLFHASGVLRNETDGGQELRFRIVTPPIAYGKIELAAKPTDKERAAYNLIAQRDLFRPYIRKPPPPPRATETVERTPPVNPLAAMRLVGLPTWAGKPVVVILNTRDNTTRSYEVGQDLMNGEIMMVDYRPLPRTDKPYLNSPSRVIVRTGRDFYAIELGRTLADRLPLKVDQLPDSLREEVEALLPRPTTTELKAADDGQEEPLTDESAGDASVDDRDPQEQDSNDTQTPTEPQENSNAP